MYDPKVMAYSIWASKRFVHFVSRKERKGSKARKEVASACTSAIALDACAIASASERARRRFAMTFFARFASFAFFA